MSEQNKKVVKKSKPKKMRPIVKLVCLIVIGAGIYLLFGVYQEIRTTISLQQQIAQVKKQYETINDENIYLTAQRDKLTDPDYVQSYARGNYMLTKDGEQIFYLPGSED